MTSLLEMNNEDSTELLEMQVNGQEELSSILPANEQEAANVIARELNGSSTAPIISADQYKTFSDTESIRLAEEDSTKSVIDDVTGVAGGAITSEDVQEHAKRSAFDTMIAERYGIVGAPYISLERNLLAGADINNTENLQGDAAVRYRLANVSQKQAVLNYYIKQPVTASLTQVGSYFANQVAPLPFIFGGLDSRFGGDLNKLLGLEASKWNEVENRRIFGGLVASLIQDPSISPQEFSATMEAIRTRFTENGGNPLGWKEAIEQANDLSAEALTVYGTFDVASLSLIPTLAVKGAVSAGKGAGVLARTAGAVKGATVGVIEQIPLAGRVAEKIEGKGAKIVRKLAEANTKVGQLKRAGDRAGAIEELKKIYGEPTVTEFNKTAVMEHSTPSVAKGVDVVEDSVEASAGIVREKAIKEANRRVLNTGLAQSISNLKKELWPLHVQDVVDTLKLDDVIEGGKGTITSDLVAALDKGDVLTNQQTGELVARVKLRKTWAENHLGSSKDPQKRLESVDMGYKRANNAAIKLNKASNGQISAVPYKLPNGRWTVEADINTGKGWGRIYADALEERKMLKQKTWRSFVSDIATVTSNPSDISKLDILKSLDDTGIREEVSKAQKLYKGLTASEQNELENIFEMERHYNAFYDSDTLKARGLSDKQIKVHEAQVAMNDFDYVIMNAVKREELTSKGVKAVSFNNESLKGFAREIKGDSKENLFSKAKRRAICVDTLDANFAQTNLDEATFNKYLEKGYRLYESGYGDAENSARSLYYLLNPQQTTVNELPLFVMSYKAGGRKFYDKSGGFIKQLILEKDKDSKTVVAGVQTFATDKDFVGIERQCNRIEEIRSAVAKGELSKADKLINDFDMLNAPFRNAKEFSEWATGRGIDIVNVENKLETVQDGQMLSSYKTFASSHDPMGYDEVVEMLHRSSYQALESEAAMAKRRRTGGDLMGYNFGTAEVVDFEKQLSYMVQDMINNGTMKYFTDFYADRFATEFKDVVSTVKIGIDVPSPKELLLYGIVKEGLKGEKADLARAALTAQKNYFGIRGVPSAVDKAIARAGAAVAKAVGGFAEDYLHVTDKIMHGARIKVAEWTAMDPLKYVRTIGTHWYLGCFNISQLWKQAASDLAILSLEPAAAAWALKYSFPLSSILRKSDANVMKAFEEFAKKMGDAPKNMKVNFETLVRMGGFEHGVAGGAFEAKETVKGTLSKVSMLPFMIGEMQNRTLAYLTAIKAMGFDGIRPNTTQLADIANYAQQLFLNMDAHGLSNIQRGTIGKTALQFFGYRMRWLETVLFDKELTAKQRARMALINSLLVGSEGMLGVAASEVVLNAFKTDEDRLEPAFEEPNEFLEVFRQGLLNEAMDLLGVDVNLGSLFDMSYGDLWETLGDLAGLELPASGAWKGAAGGLATAYNFMQGTWFGETNIQDFEDTVAMMAQRNQLPSAWSKPILGYLLYRDGMRFNAKGILTEQSNSAMVAILRGLGFSSQKPQELQRAFVEYSKHAGDVDYYFKEIQPLFNDYAKAPTKYKENLLDRIFKSMELNPYQKNLVMKKLRSHSTIYKNILDERLAEQLKAGGYMGNNLIMEQRRKN